MEDTPIAEDHSSIGKRKRSPGLPLPGSWTGHPLPKRPRLPPKPPPSHNNDGPSLDDLPSSVLQHVLSYVDPRSLGNLVQVNRHFQSLLDSASNLSLAKLEHDVYPTRASESIWTASRRRHLPTMPKPLAGLSEKSMFALAFGVACQFCNSRLPSGTTSVVDLWHAGPGLDAVRTIWPFKVRSCATCLTPQLRKPAQVVIADDHLRPGLPFAVFTQQMHFIPQSFLHDDPPVPYGLELQKYYFLSDIEFLRSEYDGARSLGSAAIEEWLKGLDPRGQKLLADAARFEQWEISGGLRKARQTLWNPDPGLRQLRKHIAPSPTLLNMSPLVSTPAPVCDVRIAALVGLPPISTYGLPPGVEAPAVMLTMQSDTVSMGSQRSTGTQKASKSSRERARIRGYKRLEIIDRCKRLHPPISREMLERLDAYDAALQVPLQLNDSSWATLKERLLQERHKIVLQDEARSAARTAPIPGRFRPPSRTDDYVVAHADISRREKLCKTAEEYIKQKYGHGGWITYPNAPQVAADVLIHTRKQFLEDEQRLQRLQAGNGFMAFQESLKLEDMKWVFEQTIKPRTEQIRKDLFLCPECPTTTIVKYFAFESIIQHYASKHTSAFSIGTQKVSWKAEWPETPPFMSHPERVHTPTPSVTHTPTLSYKPLSVTSSSVLTSTIGWRSPDTMSLMSGTTSTYSVAPDLQPLIGSAPGHGMYEMQCDYFSNALFQGWQSTIHDLEIPSSLRLYLVVAQACAAFNQRYKNQPPLDLFLDCIHNKQDLKDFKELEHLSCAECMITGDSNSRANWALPNLVMHFQKAHLLRNLSASRPDWKTDMIALPEPALIKSMQYKPGFPANVASFLQEALTTSTLKFVSAEPVRTQVQHYDLSPPRHSHAIADSQDVSYSENMYRSYPALLQHYPSHPPCTQRHAPSVATTYGDQHRSRESWSAISRSVKHEECSKFEHHNRPIERNPWRHTKQTVTPPIADMHLEDERGSNMYSARGEPLARPDTVHSYNSRSVRHPASTADDFLSTIDAQVDAEMTGSGPGQIRGARASRPVSRSNSIAGAATLGSRRTSSEILHQEMTSDRSNYNSGLDVHQQARAQVYDRHINASIVSRASNVQAEPMRREPSEVIEFDHYGTPMQTSGRVFQETSPGQLHRRYLPYHPDAAPELSRYDLLHRQALPPTLRYTELHLYADRPAVEYIPDLACYDQAYDPETRQYFVPEQLPTRQYVSIEERPPRVQTLYDGHGRPVQYREVTLDPRREGEEEMRYAAYSRDYQERRYMGR